MSVLVSVCGGDFGWVVVQGLVCGCVSEMFCVDLLNVAVSVHDRDANTFVRVFDGDVVVVDE